MTLSTNWDTVYKVRLLRYVLRPLCILRQLRIAVYASLACTWSAMVLQDVAATKCPCWALCLQAAGLARMWQCYWKVQAGLHVGSGVLGSGIRRLHARQGTAVDARLHDPASAVLD